MCSPHPHHREHKLASCRTHAGKVGGKEALAEKGGVDAVRVVAFAYDTYTNPSKNNGAAARVVNPGGASSSHAPNFSSEAASQGSMTVSVVQAQSRVRPWMRLRRECLSRSRRACSFVRWVWIGSFLSGVVSGSHSAPSEEEFGSCGTMTLKGFSFGSAAEVLDGEACEEGDGIKEGFGFRDGYDFAATARESADFESASNEAVA